MAFSGRRYERKPHLDRFDAMSDGELYAESMVLWCVEDSGIDPDRYGEWRDWVMELDEDELRDWVRSNSASE